MRRDVILSDHATDILLEIQGESLKPGELQEREEEIARLRECVSGLPKRSRETLAATLLRRPQVRGDRQPAGSAIEPDPTERCCRLRSGLVDVHGAGARNSLVSKNEASW